MMTYGDDGQAMITKTTPIAHLRMALAALGTGLLMAVSAQAAVNMPAGSPVAGKELYSKGQCMGCHGPGGNGGGATIPRLAAQHPKYIYKQLMEFKNGRRPNSIMTPQAMPLSEQNMADIAAYLGTTQSGVALARPEILEAGQKLYLGGNSKTGLVPCAGCHGPGGRGNPFAAFPKLGGQHAEYVKAQLNAFRAAGRNDAKGERRANDAGKPGEKGMMQMIATQLTDQDIELLSNYISGLH